MSTQLDLLTDALEWLSARTGVPLENLSNHMMVIRDVAGVLERYGSIAGEPAEFDYDFQSKDWDPVLELISEIWHEDK